VAGEMRLPAYRVAEAVTAALREAQAIAADRAAESAARLVLLRRVVTLAGLAR
jgi:hypothetical protein